MTRTRGERLGLPFSPPVGYLAVARTCPMRRVPAD